MTQEFKIISKRNKLSVRYRFVIFPFYTGEFLNALSRTNMGYTLAPPPKTPPTPVGATLDWSGLVAKKGNVMLEFDSLTQIIGTEGSDTTEPMNVFSEVLDIVKASIEPTMDDYAHFYEFISNYSIDIGTAPLEMLGKIKPEGGLYDRLKDIIQEPVSTYSLHVHSSDKKVESSDWFDMNIQPVTQKWNKTVDVMTIYRNKYKAKVEKFVSNYDDNLKKIFDELIKV